MSELYRERIVACWKCELLFCDIPKRSSRHIPTAMRIWNQWIAEVHTGWHAGFQRPLMTKDEEDIASMRSIQQILEPYNGSGNRYFCSTSSFLLYGASTSAADWSDSSASISSPSLMRQTTKLDTEIAQCHIFRGILALWAVFWWLIWRLLRDRMSPASIQFQHRDPAGFGQPSGKRQAHL